MAPSGSRFSSTSIGPKKNARARSAMMGRGPVGESATRTHFYVKINAYVDNTENAGLCPPGGLLTTELDVSPRPNSNAASCADITVQYRYIA